MRNSTKIFIAIIMAQMFIHGAYAESILLSTIHTAGGSGRSPASDPQVEFVLQLGPLEMLNRPELGRGILYNDGEAGYADFISTDIENISIGLTNGEDDYLTIGVMRPEFGSRGLIVRESLSGSLRRESQWRLGNPDLEGFIIDRIRLNVNEITITPWLEGYEATYDITYEFYGTPVPEPATVLILGFGMLYIVRFRQGGMPKPLGAGMYDRRPGGPCPSFWTWGSR